MFWYDLSLGASILLLVLCIWFLGRVAAQEKTKFRAIWAHTRGMEEEGKEDKS